MREWLKLLPWKRWIFFPIKKYIVSSQEEIVLQSLRKQAVLAERDIIQKKQKKEADEKKKREKEAEKKRKVPTKLRGNIEKRLLFPFVVKNTQYRKPLFWN